VVKFVLTTILGTATGALAGGALLLFSSWLYLPNRTSIAPKTDWMLLSLLLGAFYGSVPGLFIGLASGLTHARRPAATLIGLSIGVVVAGILLSMGATWEQQPRVWMILSPLLGALVGFAVSIVNA
jgi:hypothetical protein